MAVGRLSATSRAPAKRESNWEKWELVALVGCTLLVDALAAFGVYAAVSAIL